MPKDCSASCLLRLWSWDLLLIHLSNRFCRCLQFCFLWKTLAPKTRHLISPLERQKVDSSNRRARKAQVALVARLKHGFPSQAAVIRERKHIFMSSILWNTTEEVYSLKPRLSKDLTSLISQRLALMISMTKREKQDQTRSTGIN